MVELPDPGFRVITVIVKPGQEPEVEWAGFVHYEAKAHLMRAIDLIDDDEEQEYVLRLRGKLGEGEDGQDES